MDSCAGEPCVAPSAHRTPATSASAVHYRMLDSTGLSYETSDARRSRVFHHAVRVPASLQIVLVVPGLLELPAAALAHDAALAALARHATVRAVADGIAAATLDALALDAPPAPLAALGAGLDPARGYVMFADPVVLVAGMDDVRLTGRVDDLSAAEATAMRSLLDAHFASDGLAFAAPRPDAWFARTSSPPALVATPLPRAIDRPLRPLLPEGPDGRTWRRWQDEVQMLLHDHPLNVARAARGAATVCGVWFWGGGTFPPRLPELDIAVAAADGRAGDLLRGVAAAAERRAVPLPDRLADVLRAPAAPGVAIALPPVADAPGLAALSRDWLAPAVGALLDRRVAKLQLIADGPAGAAIWSVRRPSALARLRARLAPRTFAAPRAEVST